jgi:sec-independent protein translocase protein TatA
MMMPPLAMLQMPEIIALLVLALILFGAKKLPELAKGLGQGIKEFKKATRDVTDELHNAIDHDRPSSASPPAQYPAYTEANSNESNPGYGGESTPSDIATDEAPTEPAEAKPQVPGGELVEANQGEEAEPIERAATSRAGKPD